MTLNSRFLLVLKSLISLVACLNVELQLGPDDPLEANAVKFSGLVAERLWCV